MTSLNLNLPIINSSAQSLAKPEDKNTYPSVSTKFDRVKPFDGLRRASYSRIASLFYRCVAIGCALLFLKTYNQKFNLLSSYHWYKARSSIINKNMISYSINIPQNTSLQLIEQKDLHEALKVKFGPAFENLIKQVHTANVPVDAAKILQSDMNGICWGMSNDFVAQVINRPKNESETGAILRVAKTYSNGGTDRAVMLHLIYMARDTSKLLEATQKKLKFYNDILKKQLEKEFEISKKLETSMKLEEFAVHKKEHQYSIAVRRKDREQFCYSILINLEMGFSKALNVHFTRKDQELTFENAPSGIWTLRANGEVGSPGHTMAFFKTAEGSFFFEPNIGLMDVSTEDGRTFANSILNKNYLKKDKKLVWVECSKPIGE